MEKVFEISLIFSGHEWVEAFHRYCTNSGALKINSLIYDTSALEIEKFDACIIADSHPSLNRSFVKELHNSNKLIFVVASENIYSKSFVADIGADAIFLESLTPKELTSQIHEFLSNIFPTTETIEFPAELELLDEEKLSERQVTGKCIGVLGHGGTGCTLISTELAKRLPDCVLVDFDLDHPSLAINLQSEISPNLLDAFECLSEQEDLSSVLQHNRDFEFIAGISNASFAQEIKPKETNDLIKKLKLDFTNTVIDIGRISESSKNFSNINVAIHLCDVIMISFNPSPNGALRLLELVSLLSSADLNRDKKIFAVANKFENQPAIKRSIENELHSLEIIDKTFFLPYIDKLNRFSWRAQSKTCKKFDLALDQILIALERYSADGHQDLTNKADRNLIMNSIREKEIA